MTTYKYCARCGTKIYNSSTASDVDNYCTNCLMVVKINKFNEVRKEQDAFIRGWICPSCGEVYSPYISKCPSCKLPPNSDTKNDDTCIKYNT